MKKTILASLCLSLAVFAAALYVPPLSVMPPADKESAPAPPPERAALPGDDAEITVRALLGGEIRELTLHDYLTGVLAAEMPASFETEALRAQAVAARTYTLYKMLVEPSGNHPQADVCDDITCCKAYDAPETQREKWGDNYETCAAVMENAVSSTDGVCLLYESEPALAVFHSSSAGRTESSENVWGGALPYLHSVESPETEADVPDFASSVTVTVSEFEDTVRGAHPEADFSGGVPFEDDAVYTEAGRLQSVTAGGVALSGPDLRSLFSLRSSAITLSSDGESVTLTAYGSGHGVGMSQYGANLLAKRGYDYAEILLHYYDGASLGSVGDIKVR